MGLGSATFLLVACYPRPHEYTTVPAISGVLLDAGKPVTGAAVFVAQTGAADDNYCQGLWPAGATDSNGNFQIGPLIERRFFSSVLNPPQHMHQMTSVCFKVAAQKYFGMTVLAPTDHTRSYRASCDLASTHVVFLGDGTIPGNPHGICVNPEKPFP